MPRYVISIKGGYLLHNLELSRWVLYSNTGQRIDEIDSEKAFRMIRDYKAWGRKRLKEHEDNRVT